MANHLYNIEHSKTLSYVLRHHPAKFGLTLDAQGWCDVDALLAAFAQRNIELSRETLQHVVEHNDKNGLRLTKTAQKYGPARGTRSKSSWITNPWSRRQYCFTARPNGFSTLFWSRACKNAGGTMYTSLPMWIPQQT